MLYPTAKNSLNKQSRPVVQSKRLKNHDRILYVSGLFSPPKSQENTVGLAKESEEWRSLFTMVLIAGFGVVMLLISVIGSYGILATNRLEAYEQTLVQKLDSMELEKVLMTEEIDALKTNPAYVELIAHKQLGLVRTGEVVFYLPE
ncbi:MAG: septum formation initiator family protein [SAR324 cluster bacterium]|nr:septum formation initiator family protein [SAR324 cluster bacterium]